MTKIPQLDRKRFQNVFNTTIKKHTQANNTVINT